ncbi:flagellar biosynthesis protein FlhF [Butyrivibrio sp. ob235]|uniref:flagellar biosynthesis protein FlhF n=1 Tax=Butyrivibrio sp. ob235 TaxID=1761780 RepID=UPI0008AD8FB7|nr:flagellar biosynthesis protein FlhF [Butyrivibrio sp. ob235]SEK43949.1 flagellar biosynthesis protein FlhF [Butyrivibrio sp. ob235]
MIIKKFTGKTESDATEIAKKELGDNIVIMNVRPVKKSGFFSIFAPSRIEVTVALEDEPSKVTRSVKPAKDSKTVRPSKPASMADKLLKAQADGEIPPLKVSSASQSPATQKREPVKEHVLQEESSAIEEKLDSLHNLLEQNLKNEKDDVKTDLYSEEQSDIHEEKNTVSEETLSFVRVLYNTLIENEVDEIYANQLTDEVEKVSKPNIPMEYVLANVYQKMVLKFGPASRIKESQDGPIAEIFIGPTGVGKTTTIAKLASDLCINRKKKVALLTVDTYRIAAAEQLRTYATIMDIPFRVIYSVEEMKQAAEDFKDYDYLMVDTAGHSLHNEEQKMTMIGFINALEECVETENYLVLSATTKYRDLIEIADGYSELVKYKLIFTKMDETSSAGNLYNIHMHTGAPMSYITNGQNVPSDIAVFDAQRSVKGLLGGK